MPKIASEKRKSAVVAVLLIVLALVLAVFAFAADGEEPQADPAAASGAQAASAAGEPASSSTASTAREAEPSSAASSSTGGSSAASAGPSTSAAASSSSSAQAPSASGDGAGAAAGGSQIRPGSGLGVAERRVDNALAREVVSSTATLGVPDGMTLDTGGSTFTFLTPIERALVPGDLYWLGNSLALSDSCVGNDVLAAAFQFSLETARIEGDARIAGQSVDISNAVIAGNLDALGLDVSIDARSAANGYYIGGGSISFEGAAKRFIAYGQTVYFDGVVDGDVTLSAQDIVIGPHARITGLLDIRSGQNLETLNIPAEAQIGSINTNLDHPNTIDQIAQIRSAIAPYFQVGSILFVVVAAALLGLAAFWVFENKLREANRLVRRYPLAVVVLGAIMIMFMVVIMLLGPVLIFTIPLSAVVGLLVILSLICCVPFTGASLALWWLGGHLRPSLCVAIGAGVGGALLFVPYLNAVVVIASMLYFVGYMVNIAMFGHDKEHDSSFYQRQQDEDAPGGRANGILPASVQPAPTAQGDPAAAEAGEDPATAEGAGATKGGSAGASDVAAHDVEPAADAADADAAEPDGGDEPADGHADVADGRDGRASSRPVGPDSDGAREDGAR